MGFTFGAKSQATNSLDPTTLSHTTVSDTKLLVVGIITRTINARVGGAPTYNDIAMTQVGSVVIAQGGECTAELWYLSNPPIGTYDVSIPNTNLQLLRIIASSYVNAAASGTVLDVYGTSDVSEANPSIGITTTADGEACVDVYGSGNTTPATAESQTLLYKTDEGVWSTHAQYAEQANAGLVTFSWTLDAVEDVAFIAAGFKATAITNPGALLSPGHWHSTYWLRGYWNPLYWLIYGAPSLPDLLKAGYWHANYWVRGYWNPLYWPRYGAGLIGGDSRHYYYRKKRDGDEELFSMIKELLTVMT